MVPISKGSFLGNFTFQHVNVNFYSNYVHAARIVKEWVNNNNINVSPWPAKSSDMNPIKNIWIFIYKMIYQTNFRPTNSSHL